MSMSGAIGTYPNRCYRTLIFPAYQSPNLPIYQSTSPQIYQKPMVKKLLSRRYIFYTLLVIAAMAVMARLGVWQLDRRRLGRYPGRTVGPDRALVGVRLRQRSGR